MSTKTQTKTTTSTTLASKLKLDNILQLTLVQSTLQANFKAILEALAQQDSGLSRANKDSQDRFGAMQVAQDAMNKEIQGLRELVGKLGQESSAMKSQLAAAENKNTDSPNPQAKLQSNLLQQVNKEIAAIKERENKMEANINKNAESTRIEIERLRKELGEMGKISDIGGKMKELEKMMRDMESRNKEMASKLKEVENAVKDSQGSSAQFQNLSKLIDQLNNKLQDFTNSDYKQNTENLNERLAQLQKQLQQQKSTLEQEKRLRTKLSQQLWKVHDTVSKVSDNNFSQQILNDTLKQLKREIGDLQKRMNDMSSHKGGFNDTTLHESPSKFRISDTESPVKADSGNGDLREEMLERLRQLKADLLKTMKKLDSKNQGDSAYDKKRLDAIDEAILRLDHLIAQKAGTESVKKLIDHLQSKISYIYNIFLGESEQDACIARKNWVCLSCDKKLDKYQGKVGQYLVNDKLKIKTLDQDSVGGGMNLKPSKSRVDLPHVYSKTAKRL